MLSLSLSRPALVPSCPTFDELQSQVGSDWVLTYEGDISAEAMERALDAVRHSAPNRGVNLENFSWDRIANETLKLYRAVTASVT